VKRENGKKEMKTGNPSSPQGIVKRDFDGFGCTAVHLQRCSAFDIRERRDSVQRCSETELLHSGARVQLNAH